jgi:hypothetical protein
MMQIAFMLDQRFHLNVARQKPAIGGSRQKHIESRMTAAGSRYRRSEK